jgi:hypothetical protein
VHSQHWRLLQNLPVQSFPMIIMLHLGRWLMLPACWLRAVNLHRTSFQGLRPVRTTGQSSQRDQRCGASCPGRASRPALDDHVYAPTRKSALLNTLGVAPKLRQNRFKYNSVHELNTVNRLPVHDLSAVNDCILRFKYSSTAGACDDCGNWERFYGDKLSRCT